MHSKKPRFHRREMACTKQGWMASISELKWLVFALLGVDSPHLQDWSFFSPRWLVLTCHLLSEASLSSQAHLHPWTSPLLFPSMTLLPSGLQVTFVLFVLSPYENARSIWAWISVCQLPCVCRAQYRPPVTRWMNESHTWQHREHSDTHAVTQSS